MDMWKCHIQGKQLPVPDEDSMVFWEGCRRHRLLIQQCAACDAFRFPPSPVCPECLSTLVTWQEDAGGGDVATYCVYHSELAGPGWRTDLPYVVAVVRLTYSGVHMLSNLICDDPRSVRIGLKVQITFQSAGERIMLPKFVADTGC